MGGLDKMNEREYIDGKRRMKRQETKDKKEATDNN